MNLNELTTNPGIYSIVNIQTQKRYIGMSINIRKRVMEHIKTLKGGNCVNKKLQLDYDVLPNFNLHWRVEILECHFIYDRDFLLVRERWWMIFYSPNVYNNNASTKVIKYGYRTKKIYKPDKCWKLVDTLGNDLTRINMMCINKRFECGAPLNHEKVDRYFSIYFLNLCKDYYVDGGHTLDEALKTKKYYGLDTGKPALKAS